MRRISFLNFKGGVTKTTTATNLAYALSQDGANVVLIDCDRQCNATSMLPPEVQVEATLLEVLRGQTSLIRAMYEARPGLYIVPAHNDLHLASKYLTVEGNPRVFKALQRSVISLEGVDYVFFDHQPSVTPITEAALLASDEIIIPVVMESYSVMGLVDMIQKLTEEILPNWEHEVRITGIVPCDLDYRKSMTTKYIESLKKQFGALVLPGIRTDAQVSKSQSLGKSVLEYDPQAKAAEDYRALARILAHGKIEEKV